MHISIAKIHHTQYCTYVHARMRYHALKEIHKEIIHTAKKTLLEILVVSLSIKQGFLSKYTAE